MRPKLLFMRSSSETISNGPFGVLRYIFMPISLVCVVSRKYLGMRSFEISAYLSPKPSRDPLIWGSLRKISDLIL
jgi:hypothetical protein